MNEMRNVRLLTIFNSLDAGSKNTYLPVRQAGIVYIIRAE